MPYVAQCQHIRRPCYIGAYAAARKQAPCREAISNLHACCCCSKRYSSCFLKSTRNMSDQVCSLQCGRRIRAEMHTLWEAEGGYGYKKEQGDVGVESQGHCKLFPRPRFTRLATTIESRTYAKVVANPPASRGHQQKSQGNMAQDETCRKRGQCM